MPKDILKLVVEVDLADLDDMGFDRPKPKELVGELMKIKSGEYENALYGTIVKAAFA